MHLDGQFAVAVSRVRVFAFLTDPRTVSRYMPDVRDVEIADPDHFTLTARVGVSHIKGTMVMKLAIQDRRPPVSTTVVGSGAGDITIGGKLAAFGPQGLLDRMARQTGEKFIAGITGGMAAEAALGTD